MTLSSDPSEGHVYGHEQVLLDLRSVSLALGGRPVLSDVSARVHNVTRPGRAQGQIVALLGPSGVGKSTLFRVMSGLQAPDSGAVLVHDPGAAAGGALAPVRAGTVGVVAQHYPLFAHRTVLANLVIAGQCRRRRLLAASAAASAAAGRRAQAGDDVLAEEVSTVERAQELLKRFHLTDRAHAYPAEISGGQRQRAAIAQQVMCGQSLLLLDEPFSGLDPVAKAEACALLCDVAAMDELVTLVVVSHDIASACQIADTIWLLARRPGGGGAHVHTIIDLASQGLAWHGPRPEPAVAARRHELIREITDMFLSL